jgi:hypothetical protein
MSRDEFFRKVLKAFPDAIIDEEYATGELVIATNLRFDGEDNIIPLFHDVSG